MKLQKVIERIARLPKQPELLEQVARDVGVALAAARGGEGDQASSDPRHDFEQIVRELAAHAPHPAPRAPSTPSDERKTDSTAKDTTLTDGDDEPLRQDYWAGFAAAIGTLLAAHRAANTKADARAAAMRAATSDGVARAVIVLSAAPSTGAALAAQLDVTPGAASKILAHLRGAGIARTLGAQPYPKRGARKPHVLTPLGSWLGDKLIAQRKAAGLSPLVGLPNVDSVDMDSDKSPVAAAARANRDSSQNDEQVPVDVADAG